MVKLVDRIFKPVKFEFGQVHIAGGFTTTPAAVKSKTIEGSDKKQHIFVKMAVSESWLTSACCGTRDDSRSAAFGRTSLLEQLRTCIGRKADGVDDLGDDTAVAAADDEYDPMDEIGGAPVKGPATIQLETDKRGRTRYYRNRATNCIVTVNVASRCPEVDPNCTQMRPVKLFIVDRKTVWLSIDDVAWAIRYLHEQVHLKGVPVVADNDAGPGGVVAGSVPE
jgi:hypothetical protein